MKDNFTRISFDSLFTVDKLVTIFYMELSKNFHYEGERHDFWEMVYIDKGEMICTADEKRFILKSGEMTLHKPNEFHNLSGNSSDAPNVSIITFECNSQAMKHLEGKIFRLNSQEKSLLSALFEEGLSCYKLEDEKNPLIQKLNEIPGAPVGSSQMTKNLLEIFLIQLYRNTNTVTKEMRESFLIDGIDVPYDTKEILEYLKSHIYDKIKISDISQHLNKSDSSIKKIFSKYYSGGIIQYYNSLKIKEARKLIREDNYNMTQISNMLQFDNPHYFSKCFKNIMKMSPSEYKHSIMK